MPVEGDVWEEVGTPERERLVEPQVSESKANDVLPARWALVRYAAIGAALFGLVGTFALAAPFALHRTGRPVVAEPSLQQKFSSPSESGAVLPLRRKSCMTRGGMPACPAIGLFYQPDVHKVALENILSVGKRLLSATDMELVHDIVQATFLNVSQRIQRAAPRLSISLQMVQLSDDQQEAILACLKLMGNQKVQRVGLEVARAIHQAPTLEHDTVKEHIHGKLGPLKQEIKMLRDEVVPKSLQKLWGPDHLWEMTMDMENLQIMSGNHQTTFARTESRNTSLGVEIGALEESRALVNLVKQIAKLSGQEAFLPAAVVVSQQVHRQALKCEVSSLDHDYKDLMRAWFCPLKFGSQGLDALMAVSHIPTKPRAEINLFQSLRPS